MTKQEVLSRFCALASKVGSEHFESIVATDCFCSSIFDRAECNFQFSERVMVFIEKAVTDAIVNTPKEGWDD